MFPPAPEAIRYCGLEGIARHQVQQARCRWPQSRAEGVVAHREVLS